MNQQTTRKLLSVSIDRFSLNLIVALTLLMSGQGLAQSPASTFNKLVWSDDFDGTTLNYSKWECEVNAFGGGNGELQIYTDRPDNVRVENGNLVLEARRDNAAIAGTVREYSAGRVRSKHRGDWKYGRIEVRAKMPQGSGVWPAIWMLPTDERYGGWARSGEIDILEMKGQEPNLAYGTLHYGAAWPKNQHSGETYRLPTGTFADDFHSFAIEWTEGKITWLIDGKPYQTQTKWSTDAAEFPAPFNERFHLILNVAVGGGFVGNPDGTAKFPQSMLVDYVRVYQ